MTNRCIRQGATGANDGSSWTDAWTDMPAMSAINRGDVIYYAKRTSGAYGYTILDKATSGSTRITLKPATVADHGPSTGWSDAYAGQVNIGGIEPRTDYWTIDGLSRNESDWDDYAAYGFRVSNRIFSSVNEPTANSPVSSFITVKYCDTGGPEAGDVYDAGNPDGLSLLGQTGFDLCTDWQVDHCRFHNNNLAVAFKGVDRVTFEYNRIINTFGKEAIRGSQDNACSNVIIRFNKIWNAARTIPTDGTSTPTAPIAIWGSTTVGDLDGIEIYGNTIGQDIGEEMTGGSIVIGGAPGVTANNVKIYNNTIIGFNYNGSGAKQYGIELNDDSGGTGNEVRNNLFYDVVGSYTVAAGAGTTSNNVVAGADPFVASASENLHLSAATANGFSLSAPYNTDLDGAQRGADGVWDLGAFEFSGSAVSYRGRPLAFFFALFLIVGVGSKLKSKQRRNAQHSTKYIGRKKAI